MVNKKATELMKELLKQLMKVWNVWDVEGCIIGSLLLQVFLILFASCRKRNSKKLKFIRPFIWLAYLAADGVAIFSLGLISDRINDTRNSKRYKELLAFWAPFLLLHLGGPDTITAFSLEDNEFWLRNLLKILVQFTTTGYILLQSFRNNQLLIPTLLMFVVGTIRYAERIWALYLASENGFKSLIPKTPDPGTNYLKLIHEYTLNREAGIPTSIEIPSENSGGASMSVTEEKAEKVKIAHKFFNTFKLIIADLLLGFNEANESREYLLKGSANHACKLMDIELEFAYDILYTKAAVVNRRRGYITRAICFFSTLISLFYYIFFDQHKAHEADVDLTYGLLYAALALDLISFIQLIFSNWTSVFLENHRFLKSIIYKFSTSGFLQNHPSLKPIICRFMVKRKRSMIITQYNLINSCSFNRKYLKFLEKYSSPTLIYKALDFLKHTKYDIVSHELKEFIFEELKKKTEEATNVESAKNLCSSRGHWALQNRGCYHELKWTINVEFEESILLWHIATDLCLKHDDDHTSAVNNDEIASSILVSKRRHVSKLLSEYLLYLLSCHPKMISAAEGMRQIKYQDAYEEIMSVLKSREKVELGFEELSKKAREKLLLISKQMPEKSKLVLFDACFLVKKLNEMSVIRKWEIISEVLVELLCFAACQCRGSYHAQALSRGGELVTHVWFLMALLRLGKIFHVASSMAKAKVIVRE